MNLHLTYLLILIGSILGPLALSFDKKVAFYKKWKALFVAMILPAIFYIVWDMIFTQRGVWSFNPQYITGLKLYNLPIEEVMFFFVVPYCCVFIYDCVRAYLPQLKNNRNSNAIFLLIAIGLLVAGFIFHERDYTFYTFIFTSVFMLIILGSRKYLPQFNTTAFLVAYLIILIPFLIVNGLLTAMPVVLYNDGENLGFRIWTIPFEDIFYGMLLVMMNVLGYDKLKSNT